MKYLKQLLLLTSLILITACGDSSNNGSPEVTPPPEERISRISCVGDSITAGSGLSNPATQSYPPQLATILGEDYEVGNFGISGATLLKRGSKPYWNTEQFELSKGYAPDFVVIMLGTNDTKTANWAKKDQFISDYTDLINIYKNLDSHPTVYICLPPPVFAEIAGITDARIKYELIPRIRETASLNGVSVIDNYSVLVGQKVLFPDNIHPNTEGAKIIAQTIYPFVD